MDHSLSSRPIGIFDSGIGGLTVFSAIRRLLPQESLIYLGDTARLPYGNKSAETIVRYAMEDAQFLVSRNVKAIVIACNTASAHALDTLQRRLDLPVLGVIEPGARRALAATKRRRIGIIGTAGTIASGAYERALAAIDPTVTMVAAACPLFVPLVEEGWADEEVCETIARRYLAVMQQAEIDTLILGCTHYPLLAHRIRQILGSGVTIIDSAAATASELQLLLERDRLRTPLSAGHSAIAVTDMPGHFEKLARRFLADGMPRVERVEL